MNSDESMKPSPGGTAEPYPRRKDAKFTDANEHNPLVLQDCPECRGSGRRDLRSENERGQSVRSLIVCPACGGSGTTEKVERYFPSDLLEKTAMTDEGGWLRCPGCGIVFTTRNSYSWTGYRHIRCGQRIRIEAAKLPV
jgi:hypothetical protein